MLVKIQNFILANPEWCAIFAATLLAELWLGKTKKVNSNSSLELIFTTLSKILWRKK